MVIEFIRDVFLPSRTLSNVYVNGHAYYFGCEDFRRALKAPKVYGQTAIPVGKYTMRITMSARFGKLLPLVENVPGFAGIRIHAGNSEKDTEGCLLIGMTRNNSGVQRSREAMNLFMKLLNSSGETVHTVIVSEKK